MFRFSSHPNTAGLQLGSDGPGTLSSGTCPFGGRLCDNAIYLAGEQSETGTGCSYQISSEKKKVKVECRQGSRRTKLAKWQSPSTGTPEACDEGSWEPVQEHWIRTEASYGQQMRLVLITRYCFMTTYITHPNWSRPHWSSLFCEFNFQSSLHLLWF